MKNISKITDSTKSYGDSVDWGIKYDDENFKEYKVESKDKTYSKVYQKEDKELLDEQLKEFLKDTNNISEHGGEVNIYILKSKEEA